MVDALAPTGDGHTPLDDVDQSGLIPSYIATRGELNDAEQRNISKALIRRPPSVVEVLDDVYLRELHGAMFGDVWTWAGSYRTREMNLGIPFEQITESVRTLVLDAAEWVQSKTYPPDELALRFHHRLVSIHPFPIGNGRHGRIAADYLIVGVGQERFTWGAQTVTTTDDLRQRYLSALRSADSGDLSDLLIFART